MSKLLKTYPLKTKSSQLPPQEARQFHRLIRDNQSLKSICQQMRRSELEIIDEIIILIRTGFVITKTHLEYLVGVTDEILRYLKSNLTDEDFMNLDNIGGVKAKFSTNPHITEQMLALVLNYLKVRQFLRSINIPFFDVDENQLVNGGVLLGSKTIEKIKLGVDSTPQETEVGKTFNSNQSSQRPTGAISSTQNSQTSHMFDLLGEDEDDFAAAVANIDSCLETIPLQTSQTTNQKPEIQKFEAKNPTKMPAIQTKITKTMAKKRSAPTSKYRVQYDSDSDPDASADANVNVDAADNNQEPQNKRALPQWLTTKRSTTTTSSGQPNAVRKKSFL